MVAATGNGTYERRSECDQYSRDLLLVRFPIKLFREQFV